MPYTNPTSLPSTNQEYSQFDVPQVNNPFPFEQQRQESQDFLSGFRGAIQGQETIPQISSRYENRYMLPDLREATQRYQEAASGAMSQLRDLPETVAQGSQESIMTEGQRQRVVQSQAEPIAQQAQEFGQLAEQTGQRLSQGEQLAQQALGLEMAQQEKELQPWEKQYDLMNIRQAREFTGWDSSKQRELDRLLANQAAGLSWSNAEAQRANELALAEMQYENALEQLRVSGEEQRKTKKAPTDLASLYESFFGS